MKIGKGKRVWKATPQFYEQLDAEIELMDELKTTLEITTESGDELK